MFLHRFLNAEFACPLENDRPPSYTFIDTMVPMGTLGFEKTFDLDIRTPRYIYYRIYAEDGAIPSKTPAAPSTNPFLGRIKARSVAPPHTVQTVKRSIAKVENIKDCTSTSLFLTPYSQYPMDDAGEVTILNRTGPGSTPQEPLALVAKMSNSERRALESGRRGALASAAELDTLPTEIRYLYYQLYSDSYERPSKVAIDPEEPSLGRIRVDSVAPPHSAASIKRCISRVERTPALSHADLFADISCKTPLKQGHISILRTDYPLAGLSPNEPMAIVLESPSIPGEGREYQSAFGWINLWVAKNYGQVLASPQSPVLVATGANATNNSNEAKFPGDFPVTDNNSNADLVNQSIFSSFVIVVVSFLLLQSTSIVEIFL